MTNHSRSSQAAPAAPAATALALGYAGQPIQPMSMIIMMPCAFMVPFGAQAQFAPALAPAAPAAPAPAVAPAPASQPDASAPGIKTEAGAAAPAAATRPPVGAGLPAPLVAMLRDADGPFLANEVFSATPSQPLEVIEEEVDAPEWYAITRGRFVGVVDQYTLSAVAISGVAHAARKAYTTQHLAVAAFNQALTWGGVQVA
ncbi:hypothetical protein C8F04DRAFT_1250857 [Mycena alexandri]|uniref:Uncharacterized protein n=1 Tax=Mycena alexandri TaxID=1745969 RepID=A0AAD6TBF0_9AGAR|nr:hypothetical protein C8F04DRAFT_1250857 [Mycena alexandri]